MKEACVKSVKTGTKTGWQTYYTDCLPEFFFFGMPYKGCKLIKELKTTLIKQNKK